MIKPIQLPKEVVNALTPRIGDEHKAFYFYKAASNRCNEKGYFKAAKYFANESADELTHSEKLEKFIRDWNVIPELDTIEKPELEFAGLVDIIEQAYQMEYDLYEAYEETSKTVFKIGDLCAFDLLQEFRTIQKDSVAEYSDFLNQLELIDANDKFQLFYFENKHFK
jgi:ferritin